MNKKIIVGVLSTAFLFSTFSTTAFAANSNGDVITTTVANQSESGILKNTEVEQIVRKELSIPADYKVNTIDLTTQDTKDKQLWNINFQRETANSGTLMINVIASATDGKIYSFSKTENGNSVVKVLPDQAKKSAVDFINKMCPGVFKELEEVTPKSPKILYYKFIQPVIYSNNYRYSFVRKVNGELLPNNYFNIDVSPYTGEVIGYETKWNDAEYTANSKELDLNSIKDVFNKQDNLTLKYVRLSKDNNEKTTVPVLTPVYTYTQKDSGKVDAVSGKLYKDDEIYSWDFPNRYVPVYKTMINGVNLADATAAEKKETIPEDGVMSKEKAQTIVFDKIKKYIDTSDFRLESSQYTSSSYSAASDKEWTLSWVSDDKSENLSATVSALTGKVLTLNYNKPVYYLDSLAKNETTNKVISNEEATKFTKDAVETIFPEINGQYKIELTKSDESTDYSFNSVRYINNIPYDENNVGMTFDGSKKVITSLSYNWDEVNAKPVDNSLSKNQISDILFSKVGFDKYLIQLNDQDVYDKEKLEVPVKQANLVYSLKDFGFNYIDAATGKFLDYSGNEYKAVQDSSNTVFTDINNSKYKNEIIFMNKMNKIAETSDKFNPSGKLLKKDAVKWIVLMDLGKVYYAPENNTTSDNDETKFKDLDKNDPYYTYANSAVSQGIIDKSDTFNGDSVVTKQDVTKWLINALGMSDVAKYSKMFKNPYTNANKMPEDFAGYAALANYYNIFGDKNKKTEFDLNKSFTRDEFIAFVYHTIESWHKN